MQCKWLYASLWTELDHREVGSMHVARCTKLQGAGFRGVLRCHFHLTVPVINMLCSYHRMLMAKSNHADPLFFGEQVGNYCNARRCQYCEPLVVLLSRSARQVGLSQVG